MNYLYKVQKNNTMFPKNKQQTDSLNIIGSGSKITGDIHSSDSLRIDGEVAGNVYSTSRLYVSESAKICGNIYCKDAEICGEISGDVESKGRLSIKESGRIKGELVYTELQVDAGAELTCSVRKLDREAKLSVEHKADKVEKAS